MRLNLSKHRKVSTRRAHRPDAQVYRSMRRIGGRNGLRWTWVLFIILVLAVVGICVMWWMLK